jgi:hypothetical protein
MLSILVHRHIDSLSNSRIRILYHWNNTTNHGVFTLSGMDEQLTVELLQALFHIFDANAIVVQFGLFWSFTKRMMTCCASANLLALALASWMMR